MLKRASESVIVVFSESIVYMMSQDEVKSGNITPLLGREFHRPVQFWLIGFVNMPRVLRGAGIFLSFLSRFPPLSRVVARVWAFGSFSYFAVSTVGTVDVWGITFSTKVSTFIAMWANVYMTFSSVVVVFGGINPVEGWWRRRRFVDF